MKEDFFSKNNSEQINRKNEAKKKPLWFIKKGIKNSKEGKKKRLNKPIQILGSIQILKNSITIKRILQKKDILFISTKQERYDENIRKIFHLIAIIIPFMVIFFSQKCAIILLLSILIPVLIIDYNNFYLKMKKFSYSSILLQLFREHELIKGKLSGFSWLLIGLLLSITVFDKYLISLSMMIFVISDASAALIGKNFGRIKLCGKKTLEGTISFIVFGLATYYVFIYKILKLKVITDLFKINPTMIEFNPLYVIIAIFLSSIIELVAKNIDIDDNIAVPVGFCLIYKILVIISLF